VRNLLYSTEALGEVFRVKFSQRRSWIYSYSYSRYYKCYSLVIIMQIVFRMWR